MTESHGVIILWNDGIITYDSNESRLDIDTVMASLESQVITWSIKRPDGNTIELLGPGAVSLSGAESMGFMIIRTPSRVKSPKWILWIGRINEAAGFIENARKRAVVDGYELVRRPYKLTSNPESN